ncbi:MAG: hypothetical protein SFW36_21065 [Leptolyngbyaceae cyanobacterium bins.59]|nr:hypothetical protein [Leptolyngbyaceae cyanobacterium bins.59]
MLKKVPWISIVLLVLAYGLFGWYLFRFTPYQITLLLVIAFLVFQAIVLTSPPRRVATRFINWVMSSGVRLIFGLTLASVGVLFLLTSPELAHVLVGLAASGLLRLDLQVLGVRRSITFWTLLLLGFLGLGSGWAVYRVMMPPPTTPTHQAPAFHPPDLKQREGHPEKPAVPKTEKTAPAKNVPESHAPASPATLKDPHLAE